LESLNPIIFKCCCHFGHNFHRIPQSFHKDSLPSHCIRLQLGRVNVLCSCKVQRSQPLLFLLDFILRICITGFERRCRSLRNRPFLPRSSYLARINQSRSSIHYCFTREEFCLFKNLNMSASLFNRLQLKIDK
jgi:hypothetical protein